MVTTVTFTEEEKAIIKARNLTSMIIVERDVPADQDEEKHANRGIATRVVTGLIKGADANNFHLSVTKLLKGPDTYFFNDLAQTKGYSEELKERLADLKGYIEANEEAGKDESFEL